VASGADKSELDAAVGAILDKHKGKVIEPEHDFHERYGRVEKRDLYGATLRYSQEHGWMKISMEDAIKRFLDKHGMNGCGGVTKPCEDHFDVAGGDADPDFP